MGICELQYSAKVKIRLRELAPAARGSQDAGSRNLVFTFQLSTVEQPPSSLISQERIYGLKIPHHSSPARPSMLSLVLKSACDGNAGGTGGREE